MQWSRYPQDILIGIIGSILAAIIIGVAAGFWKNWPRSNPDDTPRDLIFATLITALVIGVDIIGLFFFYDYQRTIFNILVGALAIVCAVIIIYLALSRPINKWQYSGLASLCIVGIFCSILTVSLRRAADTLIFTNDKEVYTFDDGTANEWRPFVWEDSYVFFKNSGGFTVAGQDIEVGGRHGPFLKYNLDLDSPSPVYPRLRSAVFRPTAGKIYTVIANVYYEPEAQYKDIRVYAGFIADDGIKKNESYAQTLEPGKWNTISWSLFSPVFLDDKGQNTFDKYISGFSRQSASMQLGRNIRDAEINQIGIQFSMLGNDTQHEFKGVVYIDNVTILHP